MSALSKLVYLTITIMFLGTSGMAIAAEQSSGSGEIVLSDTMHASAKVVKINKKTREITLRNEAGEEMAFIAGKEVRNFKQIKKGDVVEVDYNVAAATKLKKVGETETATDATGVARAPAGDKPGVAMMHSSTIVATVMAVDKEHRLLAVKGPRGNTVVVKVPPEMKTFDGLKKGDKISAQLTEALAIAVRTPKK